MKGLGFRASGFKGLELGRTFEWVDEVVKGFCTAVWVYGRFWVYDFMRLYRGAVRFDFRSR